MNFKKIVRSYWKPALVAGVAFAAGMFLGPIGGKAVDFLLPKALDYVSDTPITDIINHENPFGDQSKPEPVVPQTAPEGQGTVQVKSVYVKAPRATLEQVAKDWGIEGRLDCRVVQR